MLKKEKEMRNMPNSNKLYKTLDKLIAAGAVEVGYRVDDNGKRLFTDLELDGFFIVVTDDIVAYWISKAKNIVKNLPILLE